MKLILATRNEGKREELKSLLRDLDIEVSSLADHPEVPEIVEDGRTFLENAVKKARQVQATTGHWVLADDSGLEVDALGGGRPGIHSARYAGKQGDYAANNEKLLREMVNVPDGKRRAQFKCVIVLISPEGSMWHVDGVCEGEIARDHAGRGGFGFDPLFYIPHKGKTMAELSMEEKNEISHRGQALRRVREILIEILRENKNRE